MIKINCDVSYSNLYNELQDLLGDFYDKATIAKACKFLKGCGVVHFDIKNFNSKEDFDKICISESRILESDGKLEVMDIEFEVFNDNLIPGYISKVVIPAKGNLPAKCISKKESSPLLFDKTLIFKTVESVKYGRTNSKILRDKYLYGFIMNEGNVALEA